MMMLRSDRFGVIHDVVFHDIYRLGGLDFDPDVIIDVGANVGISCMFSRLIFPKAKIIAIEPNPDNFLQLKEDFKDDNTAFLNAAIGEGKIWRQKGMTNGSHESYMSIGLGYPDFSKDERYEQVECETLRLSGIVDNFVKEGQKYYVKLDCEGAENFIITHPASLEALKKADYVAIEVHTYAQNGVTYENVKEGIANFKKDMEATHNCVSDGFMFYARKK